MPTLSEMHDLGRHVGDIEACLHDLDEALRTHDAPGMEKASQALHQTLAAAMAAFRHAQHLGNEPISGELRQRLTLAQTRVSALQSAVHRASTSLQRTLGVLLPQKAQAEGEAYASLGQRRPVLSALGKAYGA